MINTAVNSGNILKNIDKLIWKTYKKQKPE